MGVRYTSSGVSEMSEFEAEHCDWCGEVSGPYMSSVWSDSRAERLRVHAVCAEALRAKEQRIAASKFDAYFSHLSPEARAFLAGEKP